MKRGGTPSKGSRPRGVVGYTPARASRTLRLKYARRGFGPLGRRRPGRPAYRFAAKRTGAA